jgi:peptidylprolyl isomerase
MRGNPVVFLDVAVEGVFLGRLEVTLRADVVPRTAENFRCLCTGELGDSSSVLMVSQISE